MATETQASAFTSLVNKATLLAEQVGSGLYESCTEVDVFPSMVETIRLRHAFWAKQLKKYGARGENLIVPKVQAATKKLREEETRLRKLHSSCYMQCFAASKFMFPKELAASIQGIIDVLDNLPALLKDRIEPQIVITVEKSNQDLKAHPKLTSTWKNVEEPLLQQQAKSRRRSSLPFSAEKRYVTVDSSVAQLQHALETTKGPHVVILQGGPGTGKSSLARHLALHYQHDQYAHSSSNFVDGVFYLSCEGRVDIKAKQLELLHIVGYPLHLVLASGESQQLDRAAIHRKLVEHMENRKALVVLDNVDNCDLLQHLLVPFPRVKYLVTSELKLLWMDTLNIPIPPIQMQDARKILTQHMDLDPPAGSSDCVSQSLLQEVADDMIVTTGANPLALVSLSLAVGNASRWLEVEDKLLRSLQKADLEGFNGQGETPYPREVTVSIALAVDHLPLDAKSILVAVAAFDDLPIPEVVVRLLVKCTDGNIEKFTTWRAYLVQRGFIQQDLHTVPWSNHRQSTLTIHGIRKHCVTIALKDEIGQIVDNLLDRVQVGNEKPEAGLSSDIALIAALFVVYGERKVAVKAAARLGVSGFGHIGGLILVWLAPIVSLLRVADDQKEWQQQFHMTHILAREAILDFICYGNPENAITGLLALPEVQLTVSWALAVHALEKPLMIASVGILNGLITLLDKNIDPSTQKTAAWTLTNIAASDGKNFNFSRFPGFLQGFVRLLDTAKDEETQTIAAWMLMVLAEAEENRVEMAAFPDALQVLIKGLSTRVGTSLKSDTQTNAAWALAHITTARETKATVAALPGALRGADKALRPVGVQGLVRLLGKDVKPYTQSKAAWALANMAEAEVNKVKIAIFPGALDGLVGLLSVEEFDNSLDSPYHHGNELLAASRALSNLNAAWALASLSDAKQNKISIAKFPGALKGLVRLLNKDVTSQTRCSAAWALVHLAEAMENKVAIISIPGAVEGLVGLFDLSDSVNNHRDLQQHATWAWRNLSAAWALGSLADIEKNRAVVAVCPGVVKGLVGLLGNNKNVSVHIQSRAVWALANIAAAEAQQEAIAAFPGALEGLVGLLNNEMTLHTQSNAARALAHIVEARKNRVVVAKYPGALDGLVSLLATDVVNSYNTQNNAARALATMATAEENHVGMASFPGALEGLTKLLSNTESPAVQINAAWALANLAETTANKAKILAVPGVIKRLLMLLEEGVEARVQAVAARTLTQIAAKMSNRLILSSGAAYRSRAVINMEMENYSQALSDLDRASQLQPGNPYNFSWRRFVRVMLKDYQGALRDANKAVELQRHKPFHWQERGVLKRMMGNLEGALSDLNKALEINPYDYESLKHRAYVKFLMQDKAGACMDADRAMDIRPLHLDDPAYGVGFLGGYNVEFLGYKLK